MNPTDLAKILDELGQRFGPTGEHVFQLAVRQVYIDAAIGGIEALLGLVIVTILGIVALRFAKDAWKKDNENYESQKDGYSYVSKPDAFPYFMIGGLTFGFGSILVVGLVVQLFSSLSNLLNPEYAALRNLISQIK